MATDVPSCSYLTLKDEKLLKFQFSIDGLQVRAEAGYEPVSKHFQNDVTAGLQKGLCCPKF